MWSKIIVLFVIPILILSGSGAVPARNDGGGVFAQYRLSTSSSFRYVIVRNEVAKAFPVRQVWVLLEERAFTEENLKSLYQLVVKRYPAPYQMNIWVYTRLVDVPTPEEADEGGMSETNASSPPSGAPTAVCVRNERTEYINYFYPTPSGQEHGKIVIRAPEKPQSK